MESNEQSIADNNTDRLMLIPEIAKLMQTSPSLIKKLLDKGVIPVLKFGRIRKVRKSAYEKFLAENEGKDIVELSR